MMSAELPSSHPRRHKINVLTSLSPQGMISPLSFTWRRRNYTITSWGRRWQVPEGEHFLVMTAGGRMFELVHRLPEDEWILLSAAPRQVAV